MLALSLFLYMQTVNNTHTSKWIHTYVGTHHEIEHFECEHIKWTLLLFFFFIIILQRFYGGCHDNFLACNFSSSSEIFIVYVSAQYEKGFNSV